jgi:radical SAM superfamily enzyme YgiQ (UPF0313 family)
MPNLYDGVTRCLLVQTKFSGSHFWNYHEVCTMVGAKYPAAPLGLLTVAALLPQHWTIRLIDENVEPLLDVHLDWADLVCTGVMLPQQKNALDFIRRVHDRERMVVVGGPDPSSGPEIYKEADFLVLGEGEITIPMFLADLKNGAKSGRYQSGERADMLKAVTPRYDLIRFRDYIMTGIQFIRGCPFNCEFCNVAELYGSTPRFKTNEQVIRELQCLYDLGHRGHVDLVDENFIGDRTKAKKLLREMKAWSLNHNHPFYFSTEASVNLAGDDELLQLMQDLDFRYVFLGVETPEIDTLAVNGKVQNLKRPIEEAVRKILSYGIICNGGFVLGFDSESKEIAEKMTESIQATGICVAMVSLLFALPGTQLTRRLASEGRLFTQTSIFINGSFIDQTTSGLNFVTRIPRTRILKNYIRVLSAIYDPPNYYRRVIHTGLNIRSRYKYNPSLGTWFNYLRSVFRVSLKEGFTPATAVYYWRMVFTVLVRNPRGIRPAINLAALYIHFRKQKDYIVLSMDDLIAEVEKNGEEAYNEKMMRKNDQ